MLEEIIDSKTESAILSFFLTAPERSYSILEISKRLSIPGHKCAHGLGKLVSVGVLKAFSKKGKRYYIVNSNYKLLPEMREYWQKNGTKYQDELYTAIRRLGNVKAAFLSGVFCGHTTLPVDLLLVGKINLNKLFNFLKAAEKMMGQEINYSIMSVDEFIQRRDTFDRFIKDIFDYRHLVVVDDLKSKKKK